MKRRRLWGTFGLIGLMVLCIGSSFLSTTGKGGSDIQPEAKEEVLYAGTENVLEVVDYGMNGTNTLLLKTSTAKVPVAEDTVKTDTIISVLDKKDDWIPGRFDKTRKNITEDNSYLSLNSSFPVESNCYRMSVSNKSYRMIVNKFNKKDKFIGYVDLCNGEMLYLSDSVKYITISIYQYKGRKLSENSCQSMLKDLKNGLKFTMAKTKVSDQLDKEKEQLTAEVHIESLSNRYNYRTGWFKSWGGVYEKIEGSLCTRNFYKVDSKPYIVNVNDSRIELIITEYDSKGKWIKFNESMKNGDKFVKQPKTVYIGLMIKSCKWGVDLNPLFENGLRIDLASKRYIDKTSTIDFGKADFSDADHWKAGAYLPETGEYIIDVNKICYETFCSVEDKEYEVNLPAGYLMMSILELDKNGKVIINNNLQSGQKWKKSKTTNKIAITVYGNSKTYTVKDYKGFIGDYPAFGIKEHIRYDHNTKMKDITAWEFMNTVNVGWNLGNSLDSYLKTSTKPLNPQQEVYWGNPYITKDLIDYVAKCGFNTIRIPVTWYYNTYKDKNGNLKINEEWLDRVQDVVDYAIANDMYVILNTHHEQPILYAGTNDADMKKVMKNAQSIWTNIAERFKTYDEHLIFEAYNEIDNIELYWNYSDKAAGQMNELNQVFVDAVRGTGDNNANRILIVPTLLDGSGSKFYAAFKLPKDTVADKLAVQVHTYQKKFNQDIESDFAEMEKFSKQVKAPIVIGEFGTTKDYPLPELRTEQASNFVARAARHGIKCIWWDNGSEYKIIDRRDFSSSNTEMIKALLEGAKGIAYQLEQEIVLSSPEQFVDKMPNVQTGELLHTYWGTLTTDIEGNGIKVQEGKICTVNLDEINGAAGIWLQRLLFYNADGALVQTGTEIQSGYHICTVPEGAVTMRVSINSPNINISLKDYEKYLKAGDIKLGICLFDPKDIKKVKLPVTSRK